MHIFIKTLSYILLSGVVLQPAYALLQKKETYNMNDMLNTAIKYNPSIRASLASIQAARGNELQASLTLNPSISFEVEDFAGRGELSSFDGAEITASLRQTVEIAGKRTYRTEAANYQATATEHQALLNILDVLLNTQVATVKYFVAQKRLELIDKQLGTIEEAHDTIERRVEAAASSDIEHTRMDVQRKAVLIEKVNAQKTLEMATASLARVLGKDIRNIKIIDDLLEKLPVVPNQTDLISNIKNMPQNKVLELQRKKAESQLNLAKANSIPNPTFGVGLRRFNNTDSNAIVASVSIPIPVLNQNQGQIAKANAELLMAKSNMMAGVQSLEETVRNVWAQFNAAKIEATTYKTDIIPDSKKAYKQALEGYDMGRFSFLELLDTQRTLYKMQEAQLNSLLLLYETKAYIDFLIGTHRPLLKRIVYLNKEDMK